MLVLGGRNGERHVAGCRRRRLLPMAIAFATERTAPNESRDTPRSDFRPRQSIGKELGLLSALIPNVGVQTLDLSVVGAAGGPAGGTHVRQERSEVGDDGWYTQEGGGSHTFTCGASCPSNAWGNELPVVRRGYIMGVSRGRVGHHATMTHLVAFALPPGGGAGSGETSGSEADRT